MSESTSTENQSGGKRRPDPRGKKGISSASKGELEEAIAWYETWGGRAGWAVAIAVLIEVPLILWPPAHHWLEKIASAAATLVIGLGVAGEVIFHKRASIRQGELLRRSEERLRVALERTEYRSLRDGRLLAALESVPPASLVIKFLSDDPECHAYAMDFDLVFSASRWKVSWYTESYGDELVPGLIMPDRTPNDAPVIAAVRKAFSEAGIDCADSWLPRAFASTGPFGVPAEGPLAILYIGPKPPVPAA